MRDITILPVILAGGSGERLWPLSRAAYPKQFLNLFGNKHSLLQATIQRLPINSKFKAPLVICHDEYRFIVAEQLRQIDVQAAAIILEPCVNNTAPAIALAAHWARQNAADSLLLCLPADHALEELTEFQATVLNASAAALAGQLVTFGIPVSRPETGYGYIQADGNRVSRFIEKPDQASADALAKDSSYLWNSGMFLFSPEAYLQELNLYQPEIIKSSHEAFLRSKRDLNFIRADADAYQSCPKISIDYALMEHTTKAAVFKLDTKWTDIGSWQAVWEHSEKDLAGNSITGDVISSNTNNCLIDAQHRLVATIGVADLAIIETVDAILIANLSQSQEIKNLLAKLKLDSHNSATAHRQVIRPWGWYDCIASGPGFQVKKIRVNPGKSLSLQMHNFRSEHWIVVSGTANIIRAEESFVLNANQSTFIPQGTKHQLSNLNAGPLEIIEVQSGSYLGEDDIIRFSDAYGRVTENAS